MSIMKVQGQTGAINILLIPFILSLLLLGGALAFGYWAYGERSDYKDNVNAKIDEALVVARQQISTKKDTEFAEKEKQPYKTYTGPSAYGSIRIDYPKTWSSYVADNGDGDPFVNGYFYPNTVPNVATDNQTFALRLEVTQQSYDQIMANYQSQIEDGKVSVSAFKAAKVPNVIGSRLDGAVEDEMNGVMILLPMRDKTLKLWTNSTQFKSDFETHILPNFTFSP
jgi:hypothetical protein